MNPGSIRASGESIVQDSLTIKSQIWKKNSMLMKDNVPDFNHVFCLVLNYDCVNK